MEFKPLDLQIAVHRTNEASIAQHHDQSKPQLDQQLLAGQHVRIQEKERTRSSEIDESAKSSVRDGKSSFSGNKQGNHQEQSDQQLNQQAHSYPAEHPFKGKHIDFSL